MTVGAESLGGRAAWGVVWALLTTVGARVVSLITLAVLARILAPTEFGVIAFALAFLAYVDTISDLGTSAALVYWPSRWRDVAQVTFMVGLSMSVLWLALTWVLAPAIADLFNTPGSAPVLRALAWSFPIRALGATHDAILQKELRFRARMTPELAMVFAKAAVSLALAAVGFGVWSLVWGQLAGLATWTVALWILSGWRPTLSFPRGLASPVLAYGRGIIGVNLVAALVHHADALVVARLLGVTALGFYQIAARIPEIAVSAMVGITGKVLFPAFSRLHAAGRELRAGYLTALRYIALLTVPASLTLFMLAAPLVHVVFGAQWDSAVPILRALAVYAGVRSLGSYTGDLLKATGRSGLLARLGLARAAVLIPAMIFGARAGAAGVAWALAAVTAGYLVVSLALARRISGAGYGDMLEAMRPALMGSAPLFLALLAWLRLGAPLPAPLMLTAAIAFGAAAYVVTVRLGSPEVYRDAIERLRPRRHSSVPDEPPTPPRSDLPPGLLREVK